MRAVELARAASLTVIAGTSVACATLPQDPVQRALYSDLRQIVDTSERVGWKIDRTQLEEVAGAALQSVCQVEEERRLELLDWLDERVTEEGGPAEEAYHANGNDLGGLAELLTLERMRAMLEYADGLSADDCPFWLEPDPEFAGVQADTDRLVILAESMGGASLVLQNGEVGLGAGGAFRIIPAYGFNHRITAGLGIEFGGTGAISLSGEQAVSARLVGGVPFLFRVHDDTWVFDAELTPLVQYHDSTVTFPPGFRGALGLGIGAVRIGSIMPVGVVFAAYEYQPSFRDLFATHAIRIGTRIGVDFDP